MSREQQLEEANRAVAHLVDLPFRGLTESYCDYFDFGKYSHYRTNRGTHKWRAQALLACSCPWRFHGPDILYEWKPEIEDAFDYMEPEEAEQYRRLGVEIGKGCRSKTMKVLSATVGDFGSLDIRMSRGFGLHLFPSQVGRGIHWDLFLDLDDGTFMGVGCQEIDCHLVVEVKKPGTYEV